jgi:hypothetical protein
MIDIPHTMRKFKQALEDEIQELEDTPENEVPTVVEFRIKVYVQKNLKQTRVKVLPHI